LRSKQKGNFLEKRRFIDDHQLRDNSTLLQPRPFPESFVVAIIDSNRRSWSTQACRAVSGIHPEPAEKDNVAEAIDHVLHEVEAARRDLSMTRFCLQQAEVLRRIDRAKANIPGLMQSRTRKKGTRRACERPAGQRP
jgi:hypothetical protein